MLPIAETNKTTLWYEFGRWLHAMTDEVILNQPV